MIDKTLKGTRRNAHMWKIKMPFWHTAYKIQRRFMCQNHVNQL